MDNKYGYNVNLVSSSSDSVDGSSFELTPSDHSIGIYDGGMKNIGASLSETRYKAGGFSRIAGLENELPEITLTIQAPAFGAFEPKRKFRELDKWISENKNEFYISIAEQDTEKRAKVRLKKTDYQNIANNLLTQDYVFSMDSPWFSQVIFARREVPNDGSDVGFIFEKMSNSVVFDLMGNGVRFDNQAEGFTATSFSYFDKGLQFSDLGSPFKIELKPTDKNIAIVINGTLVSFTIPDVLVSDGGTITYSTIPLQREVEYHSTSFPAVKLVPYLDSISVNPFVTFKTGDTNTFSVDGATIERIEIVQIDEGR